MSIKLCVEGYCQKCREFDADVERNVSEDIWGNVIRVETTVSCVHRDKCHRVMEYLEEEKKDATETC